MPGATKEIVVRRYQQGQHIYVAELHRPPVKNAFNDAVYEQLIEAIAEYEANDALHVLVITGHGDYFTSGADLQQTFLSYDTKDAKNVLPSKGWAKKFMHAMLECKKAIAAAVNGRAIGIGVTLLVHCDFVFATENATFWTPFQRIGIVPEFASSYTFPHVLGALTANDLLMRSKEIDVNRAVACGLVGQVFPVQGFLQRVFAELEPLANDATAAKTLPTYKALIRRVRDPLVREALVNEYVELDRRYLSGETFAAASKVVQQIYGNKKSKL
uniref:Enoyl-CoA hydratase n=1 Tax=Globisporangium ultimum (strain ATCC 200006 / CBS 805.95 / DAOM BR144) TaxID=431595 RepID=K3X780_GLOUD